MEYFVLILFFIMIAATFFTVYFRKRKKLEFNYQDNQMEIGASSYPWVINRVEKTELSLYNPPHKLSLSDHLVDSVGQIINATPKAKDLVQTHKQIIIKFKPEIIQKFNTGELSLLNVKKSKDKFRAIAIDNKKRFASHGHIEVRNVKKVNPAQLANVALGLMSVVTAQEYLDRINQQLKKLDKKVDTLLRQYKNDKFGIIKGNIDYLMSIYPRIFDISDEELRNYNNQIQGIYRESLQQCSSIINELPNLINNIKAITIKSFNAKIDEYETEIKFEIHNFEELISLSLGNLEVIMICLKVRIDLGHDDPKIIENQMISLEKNLNEVVDKHNEFFKSVYNKVTEINPFFRTSIQINNRKKEIIENISAMKRMLEIRIQDVKNISNNKINLGNQSFDLQIEHDLEGNIISVNKLEKTKSTA